MARKANEDERLDDPNLERAIKYLAEKGATKKNACQMLNISYNTARLDKLLSAYKERKIKDAERRAEKRGKSATPEEKAYIITEYLSGATIDSISKALFRGVIFIKSILEYYDVPLRKSSPDYFHPELIPEGAMADSFVEGECVYSVRYDCLATIIKEAVSKQGRCYMIWLKGENQKQFAYQPVWELASLRKLREEGIQI
jgi:hypothetical protein